MNANDKDTLKRVPAWGLLLSVVLEHVLTAKQSAQRQTAVTIASIIINTLTDFYLRQASFMSVSDMI